MRPEKECRLAITTFLDTSTEKKQNRRRIHEILLQNREIFAASFVRDFESKQFLTRSQMSQRPYSVRAFTTNRSNGVPKLPIVLVHGLMGFVQLNPLQKLIPTMPALHYFRGVVTHLRSLGATVLTPSLPPVSSIRQRSQVLHDFLLDSKARGEWGASKQVHLIGHSMGGLDARHVVCARGAGAFVSSVTTLVSPHRGSPVADWLLGLSPTARSALAYLHQNQTRVDLRAFEDLTTEQMREFNSQVPDHPLVRYFSFSAQKPYGEVQPMLQWTHKIVERSEGLNDGLVSVSSAKWGEHVQTLHCDHNELINWNMSIGGLSLFHANSSTSFNSLQFFRELAAMLARQEAEQPAVVSTQHSSAKTIMH
jgi:triacylglycerol lipase